MKYRYEYEISKVSLRGRGVSLEDDGDVQQELEVSRGS